VFGCLVVEICEIFLCVKVRNVASGLQCCLVVTTTLVAN